MTGTRVWKTHQRPSATNTEFQQPTPAPQIFFNQKSEPAKEGRSAGITMYQKYIRRNVLRRSLRVRAPSDLELTSSELGGQALNIAGPHPHFAAQTQKTLQHSVGRPDPNPSHQIGRTVAGCSYPLRG